MQTRFLSRNKDIVAINKCVSFSWITPIVLNHCAEVERRWRPGALKCTTQIGTILLTVPTRVL